MDLAFVGALACLCLIGAGVALYVAIFGDEHDESIGDDVPHS